MKAEPVGTEIPPASSHSSFALDTVPKEEFGELNPF